MNMLLRLPEVQKRTGLSRSAIYQRITAGTFPRSVSLGPRAVGWPENEILDWIEARIRESRNAAARGAP